MFLICPGHSPEFLKQNDAGFKDTLLKYIDRTCKKDSEVPVSAIPRCRKLYRYPWQVCSYQGNYSRIQDDSRRRT